MKILVVHEYFLSPHSRYGSGSRWNQFAKYWVQSGHQVTVIAGASDGNGEKIDAYRGKFICKEADSSGATVYRCHVSEAYNKNFIGRLWAYFSFVFSGLFAGLFKAGPQDIIVTSSPPLFVGIIGVLLSKIRRCPHVFDIRDLWPESAIDTGVLTNPLMIKLSYALEKWIYKNSAWLNALTPAFVEKLREKGLSPAKISMVPNACDFDLLPDDNKRDEIRRKLGFAEDDIVISYVGAHGLANHLEQLLETARIFREEGNSKVKILFVGSGMRKEHLKNLATEWQLDNVIFHEPVPKDEIFYYLQASDICSAVLKKVDTFKTVYPNKMFDYMSLKKPIIIAIDGVARKVVEESESGIFCEPENSRAIADGIIRLAGAPQLRIRMGESGYAYVQKFFDRQKLADKYENILLRCAGKHEKSHSDLLDCEKYDVQIKVPNAEDWVGAAKLISSAIPNTVISHLGKNFGAKFYSEMAKRDDTCSFVAVDSSNTVLGAIVASLNKPQAYREAMRDNRVGLALRANLRMLSPAVIAWVIKGLVYRGRDAQPEPRPDAELIAIAVKPEARGQGIAGKLVNAMEDFFRSKGLSGQYVILTEQSNRLSNDFYERIGYKLHVTSQHHGRAINEWRGSV